MRAFFLFLGLVLGLWLGYCREPWSLACMAILSLIALILSVKKKEALWYVIALLLGAGIGLTLSLLPVLEGKRTIVGVVTKTSENYFIVLSFQGRYYVSAEEHLYEVGDWVSVSGTFKPFVRTTYESRFDFGEYLSFLGVRSEVAYPKIAGRLLLPLRFRTYEKAFLQNFSSEAQGALSALLFNRKDYSSLAVSLASSLNVLFLLSASGMFFSLAFRGIRKILGKHIDNEKALGAIVLVFEWLFVPIALRKVGLARVLLKDTLAFVNKYPLKERWNRVEVLSYSGLFLLALWPFAAFQSGFLIGYGLSFILYFASSFIKGHKGAWKRKILGLFLIRLLILPVSASTEGELHLFGFLIAECCLPYAVLLFVLGWLSYAFVAIPPLLNPLCQGFLGMMGALQKIDVILYIPPSGKLGTLVFYLLFVFLLWLSEIKMRSLRIKTGAIAVLAYLISLVPVLSPFTEEVSFINVGQGDCILLRDRFKTAMIDTGGNIGFDMAKEVLIPYLRKKRIYHIDYLFITHHDFDHYGAADSLRRLYDVRHYVDDIDPFPIKVGSMVFANYNEYGGTEENDTSLVLYTELMGKKWLFTGDAPKEIERKIIADHPELDCDILKVGHHGSDTSTCEEFIATITPQEAVISVGAKNTYGHPKQVVLATLKKYGVRIRRTDLEGTITYARLCSPWV